MAILGGEDAKYNEAYQATTQDWTNAYKNNPYFQPSYEAVKAQGYDPNTNYARGLIFGAMDQGANPQVDPMTQFFQQMMANQNRGGGGTDNRNAIINALRQRMKADPYASLRAALQRNASGAQQTGAQAVAALRSQIGQMQNPYANVKFDTPMPATNPLAAYMQQSGASGEQVDALSNWLGSLSANAASADQQMADRLSLSTQNDIQQRLADVGFSEAAFKQALAQNLSTQQSALDAQKSQYQNDILMQLAQLGATG